MHTYIRFIREGGNLLASECCSAFIAGLFVAFFVLDFRKCRDFVYVCRNYSFKMANP